jgi:hypothetical protein
MVNEQPELAAWLEELEAEQAAKALVIATLRQKLGLEPSSGLPPIAPTVAAPRASNGTIPHHGPLRADTFFGLSIPEAIKKYLAIAKRPQSPKAIGDALKQGGVLSQAADFYANVSTSLARLNAAGEVVNTREGWGLSAWYPNRKPVETPKPKTKKKRGTVISKSSGKAGKAQGGTTTSAPAGKPGWHEFLAKSLKEGRSMKDAASEWKQRRAGP